MEAGVVCVSVREREETVVGVVWSVSVWDGDEKETATNVVSTGESESNFSGMSHM